MQAETFVESLQCLLTQEEKLVRGEELAQLLLTTHKLELEKKTFCDDVKQRLGDADERSQDIGRQLREGKEWRDIECKEVPDYESGDVLVIRMDTNDVIRTRRMKPEERQQTMHYPDGTCVSPPKTPKGRRIQASTREDDDESDEFQKGLQ